MTGVTSSVETGKLFTLPAQETASNFKTKHEALSMLSVDDNGKFAGKIAGSKQQLVFDLRQASDFSIDGKKIKLELPEGANHARCIISYNKTDKGIELQAKMDFKHRVDGSFQRIKFQKVTLSKDDPGAKLTQDYTKLGYVVGNSTLENTGPDALAYLQYKTQKVIGSDNKTFIQTGISDSDSAIIANKGTLTTVDGQKDSSLTALPVSENAKELSESFKTGDTDVAEKIDAVKSRAIEGIGSSRSWDDVAETADSIALLHGKPTYTADVDTYSKTFTKADYSDLWKKAGLDPSSLKKDIQLLAKLPVLGEANNPVKIMRGGKFTDDQKKKFLFPIPTKTVEIIREKLGHLPNANDYAEAIERKTPGTRGNLLGSAGLLLRSVAAMDQPRSWRKDAEGCDGDGRYAPDSLIKELKKESQQKGYDSKITDAVVAIYCQENGIQVPQIENDFVQISISLTPTDTTKL